MDPKSSSTDLRTLLVACQSPNISGDEHDRLVMEIIDALKRVTNAAINRAIWKAPYHIRSFVTREVREDILQDCHFRIINKLIDSYHVDKEPYSWFSRCLTNAAENSLARTTRFDSYKEVDKPRDDEPEESEDDRLSEKFQSSFKEECKETTAVLSDRWRDICSIAKKKFPVDLINFWEENKHLVASHINNGKERNRTQIVNKVWCALEKKYTRNLIERSICFISFEVGVEFREYLPPDYAAWTVSDEEFDECLDRFYPELKLLVNSFGRETAVQIISKLAGTRFNFPSVGEMTVAINITRLSKETKMIESANVSQTEE